LPRAYPLLLAGNAVYNRMQTDAYDINKSNISNAFSVYFSLSLSSTYQQKCNSHIKAYSLILIADVVASIAAKETLRTKLSILGK
jgi:hypothetical protein